MLPNTLYLVRGLPGSGKSTFVRNLITTLTGTLFSSRHFEADQYFYDTEGNYNFDVEKLYAAHMQCQQNTLKAMEEGTNLVFVSNTFTTEKEMKPYLEMAKEKGYQIVSLVVENRHDNKSVHNVPEETMTKMRNRFSLKL